MAASTADRKYLAENWPILDLILPRASEEVVTMVASDVRNGILKLQVDYDDNMGGYVYYRKDEADLSVFECNIAIPGDLQRDDRKARPWRAMNMEARGWIGCDDGNHPTPMNHNLFLFHLLVTTMGGIGLYDEFLTPSYDRPYHIYDKSKKDVITSWGESSLGCCNEDGLYSLEDVKDLLYKSDGYQLTAENDKFVLFEKNPKKSSRKRPAVRAFECVAKMAASTADRKYLAENWPILDLILPRASEEAVKMVASDVRNGILKLQVDYNDNMGGYVYYRKDETDFSVFECNIAIPGHLQRDDGKAYPWLAMNMEARGWIGCDNGIPYRPRSMNQNLFLFHLLVTTMDGVGLYDEFLLPSADRPYHIYDKNKKDVMTNWGESTLDLDMSEDGLYSLEDVTDLLCKSGYELTAENDKFVLFEKNPKKSSRKRQRRNE